MIRLLVRLVMLGCFLWFATTVPLGKKTLWAHLSAIFATPEAKELAAGTKEEALRVAERLRRGEGGRDGGAAPPVEVRPTATSTSASSAAPSSDPAAPPGEALSAEERRALRELVKERAPARR
jgi:hypothetical protein